MNKVTIIIHMLQYADAVQAATIDCILVDFKSTMYIIPIYDESTQSLVIDEYYEYSVCVLTLCGTRREKFLMSDGAGTRLPNLVITGQVW